MTTNFPSYETVSNKAIENLLSQMTTNGNWCFPLEADCTLSAEYILLHRYFGKHIHNEGKFVSHLFSKQSENGSWPLYDGHEAGDLSCTVKCYMALKACGFLSSHPQLTKAREYIKANGGAEKSNVFTRILLAQFKQVPWQAVPWLPIEQILLPRWFPFHMSKMAYWSRCVMVPLTVLVTKQATAKIEIDIFELFNQSPWDIKDWFPDVKGFRPTLILKAEQFLRKVVPRITSEATRYKALRKASRWILDRSASEDGLGAIYPAIAGSLMALPYLEYHEVYEQSMWKAIHGLVVETEDTAWVQPCNSPVWDTAISILALRKAKVPTERYQSAADWLISKQIKCEGDWIDSANGDYIGTANGWAFQNANNYYPDTDDTAMVIKALDGFSYKTNYERSIALARHWLCIMQSKNGGYGAFDADNNHLWLNDIPFADHGAMLDPPTEDVTGRVLWALSPIKEVREYDYAGKKALVRMVKFLLNTQRDDGSWYGRWGTNYLWGTWSAITGLKSFNWWKENLSLKNRTSEAYLMAFEWLFYKQNDDGGFGESNGSYWTNDYVGAPSNAFHTALALLIFCELKNTWTLTPEESRRLQRAAKAAFEWLLLNQQTDGSWETHGHNAPGFPRVFKLKYYGYAHYFPLLALSSYHFSF